MSEIKRVKISSIIDNQIPEFLSVESPLFLDFLKQYYNSLEHQSGSIDIILNIAQYKNSKKFNNLELIEKTVLTSDVLSFDDTINVESTKGWPDSYGLLKINDEIITYLSKTDTSFQNCIRGFSGIDRLESLSNPEFLVFSSTTSAEHSSGSNVQNLSNLFLIRFFENFKYEFLPGFEARDFYGDISIENVSYKIKDLYRSKGTDSSYKLLFKILYGSDIEIVKPQEYTISPSSNSYFITKNVLVEKISGANPIDTKGNFLFQTIPGIGTVSASIFNVEYRPIGDKEFYEISLDSTSFSGNFEVSGKTRILEEVQVNSDSILVDSTVGFANSGTILVKPRNSDYIEINYTGKNVNQFTGVTNVTKFLDFGLDLIEEKFAFSYVGVGNTSKVEFRVVNVIDSIDFSKTSNLRVGDKISLSGFGRDLYNKYQFNSWIYNIPTNHNIKNISQVDSTKYRVTLFDKIYFYQNEKVFLADTLGNIVEADVLSVEYEGSDLIKKYSNRILVQVLNSVNFNILSSTIVRKKIYKANHYSDYFGDLENISTGVQNTYIDSDEKYFYVASSGLPNYTIFSTDNKKLVSTTVGTSTTDTFNVLNHNYLSGDLIYYQPGESSGITTGLYFVTKIDNNTIKLSYSKSDIFSKKYIQTTSPIINDFAYRSGLQNKTIKHQKLLKKFPLNLDGPRESFDDLNKRTSSNREVGLLVNGVELLSPSLFDENIYYGNIESIEVTNAGKDYDVIDTPPLQVKDETGTGVKGHINISGSVKEIKILNAGYGYQEKPKITISGGNGSGCILESNFVKSTVSAGFKADLNVSVADNTIKFLNSIPFDDGEEIVYDSNKNNNVPGIVNSSVYFVGIVTDNTIKLYNNKTDSLRKTNEIDIVGLSSGFHFIRTLKNKNTFTKIYVKNPGKGYSNRKIVVPSVLSGDNRTSGINTFDSYIFAKNHGFKDLDFVKYSYQGSPISGMSTLTGYYVKVIDVNKFRLYEAGIGTTLNNENYLKNKFVKFNSLGVGTHTISYPPIELKVESKSSIGSTVINVELKPIVLGSIEDVYLENGGVGYGCTDIINFHRRPNVGVASITSEAILKPIIIDGSIVDVQIINRGRGFRENSEIIISGEGNYAQIEPIVENGRLVNVNIVFGGVGYSPSNTILTLVNRGRDAKFLANVKEWKINQVIKSKNVISNDDDGIFTENKNPELGLRYVNFYVPKQLRYQLSDNLSESNKETSGILNHSPILGYAYDGNPIYGAYSYDSPTGGFIRKMNSSYVLNVDPTPGIRPPNFESGFFIDDYVYDGSGDLDQHNGRFCVTPEYPGGTYAYFSTIDINSSNESKPAYPYIIGPYFYNNPINENFLPLYNQDINIFNENLTRNVGPYYLNRSNSYYDLIDKVLDEYKQEFYVSSINSGKIEGVSIFSAGDNYKVNDQIDIDISGTEGVQSNIVVSELDGREVKSFSLEEDVISNCEFFIRLPDTVVKTSSPHGIKDGQPILISGISTITASDFEGIKYVQVSEKESQLLENIGTDLSTGISTFIKLKDINGFKVNDFIGIGTEILLITDIDVRRSGFYVNRLQNTGIHTAGIDNVVLLPREFKIPTGKVTNLTFENYTTFFDPRFSVGIGTSVTTRIVVGLGTTTFERRSIPPRSIYLPSHKFYTGQPLVYNSGLAGTSLSVNNVGSAVSFKLLDNQIVYAVNLDKDYIGLSTIGFTSFTGIGTNLQSLEFWDQTSSYGVIGAAHSLTTLNPTVTGTLSKVLGIVTTTTNHNLSVGDIVAFNVSADYNEIIKVVFDPVNRKVLMKEIEFSDTDVSVSENSIDLSSYNGEIKTGDKVVYISTSPIGGLNNYGVYYVSKTDFNYIKLCEYESDINESKFINFSSVGSGSEHKLYFVNPQISSLKTTRIEFDLSDSSLLDLELQFYFDSQFIQKINERSEFVSVREGIPGNPNAKIIIDLTNQVFPIYYNLFPRGSSEKSKTEISPDVSVRSYNKITIITHQLNNKFKVETVTDKSFSFFNTKKLTFVEKNIISNNQTNFSYKTTSLSALGPISKFKINFPGRGYKKLPSVRGIKSSLGKDAVVKLISPNVGKVETFDRVKDKFDYPTDPTLSPSLSVPTVIGIKDIRTIDYIGIISGGRRYNSPPKLIVKNNNYGIELNTIISGGSVVSVDVTKNSTSLSSPLDIISTFNSNGYEIDFITTSGNLVTLELANDPEFSPFITSGFGKTDYEYPFKIGDQIFIENCRLTDSTSGQANFNSASYNYSFFDVVDVDVDNNTVTYDMTGISTGSFGTYNDELNLGVVINKNDMPQVVMVLKDDVSYLSNEKIQSETFSGVVMDNGWDNDLNQMRLSDISGEINIGDKIFGEISKINGTVEYFNVFNLYSTLGVSRDKTSSIDLSSGILNDYLQRLSDNFYYQKFSYSIKGDIPYNVWKESVRSIVHPSGFKEFSDLQIFTKPTLNEVNLGIAKSSDMKPKILSSDTFTFINIDEIIPLNTKKNFARVYEEETLPDGSVQNVFFDEGIDLAPFILNKTNKVITIDDISSQFNGTSEQVLPTRFDNASYLLELNKQFIEEEVVGFITSVYSGITTNPNWNSSTYKKQIGYVIDAISHDIKYSSNDKSIEVGLGYWNGLGTSHISGISTQTIAGYRHVIDLSRYIINNVGVKTSYQLGNPISISTVTYNKLTGITTIVTSGNHGLSSTTSNSVVLKNLIFSYNSGAGNTTTIFPNPGIGSGNDGILSSDGFVYSVQVVNNFTLRVNPGPSTITYNYVTGGTVQKAFISTTQSIDYAVPIDSECSTTYDENCYVDVLNSIENYVGIITSIVGIGTTAKPQTVTYPSLTRGGSVVGLTTFKLKNNGTSLFKHEFSGNNIDVVENKFIISNHNFQSGQELIYSYSGGNPIGIATTSYVTGQVDTLLNVHNFNGTAILENGYDVGISTTIFGVVPNGSPSTNIQYTQVIGVNTTGLGTDATFNVLISYDGSGVPISTSVILKRGGSNYYVGQQVSISGTYFGGTNPTNNISFVISKTGPTVIQSQANQSYLSIPSIDLSGATFDIFRNIDGEIEYVNVLNGGSGYNSNSIISVAGTYIGGTGSKDNLSFSPLELGTKILPTSVFVYKLNDNEFKLSGLSTSVFLNITNVGTAIHSLSYKEPNASAIISIDGVIQKPISRKPLSISLGSTVSSASTIITISSGISSLSSRDIINIDNEYISIKTIGITSANQIEVERGYFGTVAVAHTVGAAITVLDGDFNIIGDVIYFDQAPSGKIGPVGIETGSSFGGRAFSRRFDPTIAEDKNIILDDISLSFTGIAATEFVLKSEGQTTNTIFNNVNSSTNINNNPIVLINNVFQNPTSDYTVDGAGTNVIKFLSGVPRSGKISKVSISTSYGYAPRIGAAAIPVVSSAGTISNVVVTGSGSGYRSSPFVSIASTIGFGASIVATVSAAGTISGFTIVNGGFGYTTTSVPEVLIGIPTGYSNLSVGYTGGTSGVGQGAKVTVEVGMGSSIISYKFDDPGIGYKIGDKLTPLGIVTNPSLSFEPFVLTVQEVEKDSFTGFYPGQFIQFDDISQSFNGFRKKFTLSTTLNGVKQVIGLRVPDGTDLDITNNIFIYINDILQVPNVSYKFSGSRVIFTEAPREGSKCVILYYRGSSIDVELIDPPKTIKPGDSIIIQENPTDPFDISQFDRVVKKIVTSDQLETFNYYSVGIITDPTKIRPLTWKKQTNDTIINGSLFSKSRPSLQSNIRPSATIIKKIEPTDNVIYVDNAYPLFSDLDYLSEDIRDLTIVENKTIREPIVECVVSSASTISSINIIDGGIGYANTQSPKVTISQSLIKKKDPIFNWSGVVGLSTSYDLKSIKYNDKFISVGNNSVYATSFDGINWQVSTVGFGQNSNFNSVESVGVGFSNFVISVGNLGKVIKATDYGNVISPWEQIPLVEDVSVLGFGVVNRVSSGYTGTLNEIVYSNVTNTWVTVGAAGSIFIGIGVATDSFVSKYSETLSDLNSVTFGAEYFVAVGNDGVIRSSNNGNIWEFGNSPVNTNLNKVIYAENRFVIVGDYGVIIQSIDRNLYQTIPNNLGIQNIRNIKYNYGFYVITTSSGDLYYSFDLSNWIYRSTLQPNFINDLVFVDNIGPEGRYVAIGSGATAIYAEPTYNRATAISSVTSGVVTSITIDNAGFGYDINGNSPPAIVESDSYNTELIRSFKVTGDHGIIIGVTTYITGTPGIGTTSPKISFTLKSEQYDNSTLGIGYSALNSFGILNSQLSKGDYFVITDSNVETGGDLVGITTLLGGMSNFPNSKIGTAKSFIDGVYIVEDITSPSLGIVTVTCNFAPMVDNYVKVYVRGSNRTGVGTNNYYGKYSWAKIYDYQNRILGDPKTFNVFNDNGIIGISSSPKIIRTRNVISK